MTVASFAIITDLKLPLLISIIPYVVNSSLILLTIFFAQKRADISFDGKKLMSDHRRSLVTLIAYRRPLTERKIVAMISVVVTVFTLTAVAIALLPALFS
jgi:hypothetical protein